MMRATHGCRRRDPRLQGSRRPKNAKKRKNQKRKDPGIDGPRAESCIRKDDRHVSDYLFDLDGGRVCLDFANTLSSTSGDHLAAYADLVAFAAQSHLLTRDDAAWLRAEGGRETGLADGVMVRARNLRAAIYAIFSAIAAGKRVPDSALEFVNFDLSTSLSHARVFPSGEGNPSRSAAPEVTYRWGWTGRNLDAPLWPISRSAADLLTSDQDHRLVRQCGGVDCNWLFVDTTRNRSRQWCSMRSCGNRQKARRHYQRVRDQLGDAPA
jgi:predicted RNA-binding Zn ribbon-like protein